MRVAVVAEGQYEYAIRSHGASGIPVLQHVGGNPEVLAELLRPGDELVRRPYGPWEVIDSEPPSPVSGFQHEGFCTNPPHFGRTCFVASELQRFRTKGRS